MVNVLNIQKKVLYHWPNDKKTMTRLVAEWPRHNQIPSGENSFHHYLVTAIIPFPYIYTL